MKEEIKIFKALADETRLKIIRLLLEGDHQVCNISSKLNKRQPTISLQLTKLKHLGIVKVEKEKNKRCYSIKNQLVREIIELIDKKKIAKKMFKKQKGGI